MTIKRIAISAGHSTKCRGAADIIDEVDEAWRVVRRVASVLETRGVKNWVFQDTTSTTQQTNLETICAWHNALERDLDVSVHFNSTGEGRRSEPIGTECWYVTQEDLARQVSEAVAISGLIDRGAKHSSDLYFLNHTEMPAILIEVCFVESQGDVDIYRRAFNLVCRSIADALTGDSGQFPQAEAPSLQVTGKVSWFGGPEDHGVTSSEDLAWWETWDQVVASGAQDLFLPQPPPGTTGLARRLDPKKFYLAMRWNYDEFSKEALASGELLALVRAENGRQFLARPADWGPAEDAGSGRVADISPGFMDALGIQTDDLVEILFPYKAAPHAV